MYHYKNAYEIDKPSLTRLKYILLVGDGMSDISIEELNNKTPLQIAKHPNMDKLASKGLTGLLKTIPSKCNPGTETAFLSIFGYDPIKLNTGRGPLEAAGAGIYLEQNDIALRCNLVTVINGVLMDHSAGHITSKESKKILLSLKKHYKYDDSIDFYSGVSYRHIIVLRGGVYSDKILCIPPHDAINTPVNEIFIKSIDNVGHATAQKLNQMMMDSHEFLKLHPVNIARIKLGKNPANMIWPWGQGYCPKINTLQESFGIKSAVISAVDIVKGIGKYLGMNLIKVPGATGYFDTNYEGKADYALKSLKNFDFVLIHVESPDEASHIGDAHLKVKTIEDIDSRLLGRLMEGLDKDYVIAVMPDHTTQTSNGAHSTNPVPFVIYSDHYDHGDDVKHFDEESMKSGSLGVVEGINFLDLFLKKKGFPKH